jgi:hypothetical protein
MGLLITEDGDLFFRVLNGHGRMGILLGFFGSIQLG